MSRGIRSLRIGVKNPGATLHLRDFLSRPQPQLLETPKPDALDFESEERFMSERRPNSTVYG
jgi:hypothetical protein